VRSSGDKLDISVRNCSDGKEIGLESDYNWLNGLHSQIELDWISLSCVSDKVQLFNESVSIWLNGLSDFVSIIDHS
jgi:hypothetical protein